MKIWAHTLFKNEERYLWYSVASVIDFVDRVLLWDTGSTDRSLEIAKALIKRYPDKIDFKELGNVDAESFAQARQKMLDETEADWLLMLDADEVWWEDSISRVVRSIQRSKGESLVVPMINLVGDIYHYQEKEAGRYNLVGKRGHFSLRGINRKIPGLSSRNPHGTWGWVDSEGKMIQDRDSKKIVFVDAPYVHFSHLTRSASSLKDEEVTKRKQKLKYEIGEEFPKDFFYPEVFFRPRPKIVASPWQMMSSSFFLRALVETPLRKVKRRLWQGRVGY